MSNYCLYPNQCGVGTDCSGCMGKEITRLQSEAEGLRARVAELESNTRERLFSDWPSCSDHSCIVTGKKSGMGTNGGCHCLQNASRSQLNLLSQRLVALMGR